MKNLPKESAGKLGSYFQEAANSLLLEPYALAPVRSKPARTYDPIDDTPKAEGVHVPMLLEKMKYADKDRWTETKQTLDKFGRDSGLFEKFTLKTLGHTDSDSFQILLKIAGPNTN